MSYTINKLDIIDINVKLKNIPILITKANINKNFELNLKIISGLTKNSIPVFFYTSKFNNTYIYIREVNIGSYNESYKYFIEEKNISVINEQLKDIPIKITNIKTNQIEDYFLMVNGNDYFFMSVNNDKYLKLINIKLI